MATYSSKDVSFLLVGGYSLLGYATTISENISALLEEITTLGDSWPEFAAVGVQRAEITQEGFFDDAANASNAALVGLGTAARVLCYGVQGNTIGKKFVGFSGALQSKYERIAALNALHRANAAHSGSGAVEEGLILHALTAETAAGNTEGADSQDNAASSASGGSGYVQCSALTLGGFTDLTVKVRHSADDITYADLITFTAITAAPAAQRSTVAGTVNRHLAASWAFTGAGAGPSATFFVGFKRN